MQNSLGIDFEFIDRVRESLDAGRLQLLVGAGASIDAGLPSWNELNNELIQRFLSSSYDFDLGQQELSRVAEIFAERFEREPIVDLLRDALDSNFNKLFSDALYGDERIHPNTLHYELAALGSGSQLFTFNFDTLLEQAHTDITGEKAVSVVDGATGHEETAVVHLHGILHPGGRSEGQLILSERDFHEATNDWAEKRMRQLFDHPEIDVLLVGLSVTDPRLRRLLLDRRPNARVHGKVFALLAESRCQSEAPLIDRVAHHFVRSHEKNYWEQWGIDVGFLPTPELSGVHLRATRLGVEADIWAVEGRAHLKETAIINVDELYTDDAQQTARDVLCRNLERLKKEFRVSDEEDLRMGIFIPTQDGKLRLGVKSDRVLDADVAENRTLSLTPWDRIQGAAGHAYTMGVTIKAGRGSRFMDSNFDSEMQAAWQSSRPIESLLCVPVSGGPSWVPLGVIFLSSGAQNPFWNGLERGYRWIRLQSALRSTFDGALGRRQRRLGV